MKYHFRSTPVPLLISIGIFTILSTLLFGVPTTVLGQHTNEAPFRSSGVDVELTSEPENFPNPDDQSAHGDVFLENPTGPDTFNPNSSSSVTTNSDLLLRYVFGEGFTENSGDQVFQIVDPEESDSRRKRALSRLQDLSCVDRRFPLVSLPNDTYVRFSSPEFPKNYPINYKCGWKIVAPTGQKVRVLCPKFDLSAGDLVAVSDLGTNTKILYGENKPLRNATSFTNKMFIGFLSDNSRTSSGFHCVARSLPDTVASFLQRRIGKPLPYKNGTATPVGEQEKQSITSVPTTTTSPDNSYSNQTDLSDGTQSGESAVHSTTTTSPDVTITSEQTILITSPAPTTTTKHWLLNLTPSVTQAQSISINKPYARVQKLVTYTVRKGSSHYFNDPQYLNR